MFVERLIHSKAVPFAGLIDPYYGPKNPIDIPHVVPEKPGPWAKIKTLGRLYALRDKPLMVNASLIRAIPRLAFFLRGRTAPTALILHHGNLGNLGDPAKMSRFRRALLRKLLRRYDRVGYLSDAQKAFYVGLGLTAPHLAPVDIYLPQGRTPGDREGALFQSVVAWTKEESRPIVIGSGSPAHYYHHDWPLDALTHENSRFRYLICCYGKKIPEFQQLERRVEPYRDVRLVFGLSASEFDAVLDYGQIYVRPFAIESFGIAVRDAAAKGLQIVASDVCDRPAGFIHRTGDKGDFLDKFEQALARVTDGEDKVAKTPPPRGQRVGEFLNETLLAG